MSTATELQLLLAGGARAEAAGNVRDALISYEAAAKLAPVEALPHLRLGTICHRLRDYPRAREVLSTAFDLDATNPEIAFRLGLACDALGDREAARLAYVRTMTVDPSGWQTWFLIGRDHRHLGHTDIARVAYQRALNASPEQPEVLAELGSLLSESGKADDAFPYLERAAQACPSDPSLILQLGLAYAARQQELQLGGRGQGPGITCGLAPACP
jgi:tetratricopeptide (TPR) repeat protein